MSKRKFIGRIGYCKNWHGQGEYFLFKNRWSDEDEWGLDTAFRCLDWHGEKGAVVSYEALTKVREMIQLGMEITWGDFTEEGDEDD